MTLGGRGGGGLSLFHRGSLARYISSRLCAAFHHSLREPASSQRHPVNSLTTRRRVLVDDVKRNDHIKDDGDSEFFLCPTFVFGRKPYFS